MRMSVKERLEQKELKRLEQQRKESTKGLLNINGIYFPYDYKIKINNKNIYFNLLLMGGQHYGELRTYLNASTNGKFNDYQEIIEYITKWCNCNYTILNYDEYVIMYVYNKMYKQYFDNIKNNTYADLD